MRLGPYLRTFSGPNGARAGFMYWCPGCECAHGVWVYQRNERGAQWGWNQDTTRPTFCPSVLHDTTTPRCHCYVMQGTIQFLADCGHQLAGQTVAMEPWDDGADAVAIEQATGDYAE